MSSKTNSAKVFSAMLGTCYYEDKRQGCLKQSVATSSRSGVSWRVCENCLAWMERLNTLGPTVRGSVEYIQVRRDAE